MSTGDDFAQQQQEGFSNALADLKDGPKLTLSPGANSIRILPRFKVDGTREIYFWVNHVLHWGVGPNNKMVRCIRPDGENCYICEYVAQLTQAGHTEAADKMSAANRFIMSVISLRNNEAKVKILECGQQILEGILGFATNPSWGDPADPNQGYNLTVNKAGANLGTSYTVTPDRERTAIDQGFLQLIPDLNTHFRTYSYEQQQMIVSGQDPNQQQQVAPQMPPQAAQAAQAAPVAAPPSVTPPAGAVPVTSPPVAAPPVAAPHPQPEVTPSITSSPSPPPVAAPPVAAPVGAMPPAVGEPVGGTAVTGGENPTPVVEAPQPPQEFQDQPPQPPQQ